MICSKYENIPNFESCCCWKSSHPLWANGRGEGVVCGRVGRMRESAYYISAAVPPARHLIIALSLLSRPTFISCAATTQLMNNIERDAQFPPPVPSLITARNIEPISFWSVSVDELIFVAWTSSVSNCDGSIDVAGNARWAGCHLGRAFPQPAEPPCFHHKQAASILCFNSEDLAGEADKRCRRP